MRSSFASDATSVDTFAAALDQLSVVPEYVSKLEQENADLREINARQTRRIDELTAELNK